MREISLSFLFPTPFPLSSPLFLTPLLPPFYTNLPFPPSLSLFFTFSQPFPPLLFTPLSHFHRLLSHMVCVFMDLVDSNFWLRSSTEDLHVHVCLRLDRSENNHDLRLFSWRKSYFELDRSERRWLFTTLIWKFIEQLVANVKRVA